MKADTTYCKCRRRVLPRRAPGPPTRQPRWGGLILFAEPVLPAADAVGRAKALRYRDHGPAKAGRYGTQFELTAES